MPQFTTYRERQYPTIFGVFLFLIVVETAALHLLVGKLSRPVAWVLTFSSLSVLWWLVRDFVALRQHPIVVDDDAIHVQIGRRWKVTIPCAAIASLAPYDEREPAGWLRATVLGKPDVLITLRAPLVAEGPFGLKRSFDRIGLSVDNSAGFLHAVRNTPIFCLPT